MTYEYGIKWEGYEVTSFDVYPTADKAKAMADKFNYAGPVKYGYEIVERRKASDWVNTEDPIYEFTIQFHDGRYYETSSLSYLDMCEIRDRFNSYSDHKPKLVRRIRTNDEWELV